MAMSGLPKTLIRVFSYRRQERYTYMKFQRDILNDLGR